MFKIFTKVKKVYTASTLDNPNTHRSSKSFSTIIYRRVQVKLDEVASIGSKPPVELQIPVPWGHIAAKQWGSPDGRPVLAVHGWQDNAGSFDTLAPLLPSNWNIISVDLPGHGLSTHFAQGPPYYFLEYIYTIRVIFSHFNWKKIDYIGHSMGGGIGLLYACLYPYFIDHLVSIDFVKLISFDAFNPNLPNLLVRSFEKRLQLEQRGDDEPRLYTVESAANRWINSVRKSLTQESVLTLMKRGTRKLSDDSVIFTRDRRLQLYASAITGYTTEQVECINRRLNCKLLIVKALQGGWYEKRSVYEEMRKLYQERCAKFQYTEIDGTHHVHLNNPEVVAPIITNFIT